MKSKNNFLLAVAFISGLAVMAMEISASRLLAPYFGTSIFVWTNIIGVVMVALSLGYYFGGKLAEVKPIQWLGGLPSRADLISRIAEQYDSREFGKAIRDSMQFADKVNQYVDVVKPWAMAKAGDNDDRLHELCSEFLDYFRVLTVLLAPVLPRFETKLRNF